MGAKDALKAMELLDLIALRQERMKVALEAIQQECQRGSYGKWRARIGDLALLGLRKPNG